MPPKKQSPIKDPVKNKVQPNAKAKLFKCSECEFTNKELGLVSHHVNIAHKKPFKCGSCDYTNSLKEEVMKHIQVCVVSVTFCFYLTVRGH